MGKQVAIFGGGIGGLTAAHELLERGFDVTIYDKEHHLGGKARSYSRHSLVEHGPHVSLPAEHGFRFFPAFYKHLPDTLKRIPFENKPLGVFENLVEARRLGIARENEPTVVLPFRFLRTVDDFYTGIHGFAAILFSGLSPLDLARFADRLLLLATSSDERRVGEYENSNWIEFIGGTQSSIQYRQFLAIGATRTLVACQAEKVSARTGGLTLLQLMYNYFMGGKHFDRVLNGPTSQVWIDPWLTYLHRKGLKVVNAAVEHLACKNDRISGVQISRPSAQNRSETVIADYYIAALPVDVMKKLVNKELLRADPQLYGLEELETAWMNGIQFYLDYDVPVLRGHALHIDSPWALTSISQQQFWTKELGTYSDGRVRGVLSVDISNWDAPGILYGLPAKTCARAQIKDEVWAQLKTHLNVPGSAPLLVDSNLVAWQLDRDIECGHGPADHVKSCMNLEPLLINTAGSLQYRPEAVTNIKNFFLASDYVRTNTDIATMECANEAARRAVAGLLDAAGSKARRPIVWPMLEPEVFKPIRALDRALYKAGLPHPLDMHAPFLAKAGMRALRRAAMWTGLLPPALSMRSTEVSTTERRHDELSTGVRQRLVQVERQVPPGEKIKVAVLGGGMSSIATAYMLTRKPEGRRRYEVTIYQRGWRLGGKGASGRSATRAQRIEEHGLHIWFGFYDNAFKIMRECYQKLGRTPAHPLSSLEEAFKPCNSFIVYENYKSRWIPHPSSFPTNKYRPGDDVPLPSFWEIALGAANILIGEFKSLFSRPGSVFDTQEEANAGSASADWIRSLAAEIGMDVSAAGHAAIIQALRVAHGLANMRCKEKLKFRAAENHTSLFSKLLDEFRIAFRRQYLETSDLDDTVRNYFATLDTVASIVRGLVEDRIFERGFDSINEFDFKFWLRKHGAQDSTLESGVLVRLIYDAAFAYEEGDIDKPNFAAGVAVSSLLRVFFTYKGAPCYKMQAGMGDAVFAPFYQLLKRRGVNFKFFTFVSKLSLSKDMRSIDSIDIVPQATLKTGDYLPLIKVKGLSCWPSEPLWDQLENGEIFAKSRVNFEEYSKLDGTETLTLERGKDFDLIVLGIPVAALPDMCKDLIADPTNNNFRTMVEKSSTTMTQSFQLWVNRSLKDLGWTHDENSIMSTYVEPIDTYSNMSQLLEHEDWTVEDNVQSIAYFCGVLKDSPGDTQEKVTARVKDNAREYLRGQIKRVWPASIQPGTSEFNWEYLVADRGRNGVDRLESQFFRGNFQPTERYVLTPAGSVKYRLRTDESGYDNLFLTGDWIRNGFNSGCVESAVISGMQTARAISGSTETIVGENPNWLREF